VALALVAGVAGGALGATVAQREAAEPSPSASAAAPVPVVAGEPPLDGTAAEPAAAVAAALGPAVVQIETGSGLGSGFVYDESGLVMTAYHVVSDARTVRVRLADGTRLDGQVVGSDPSTDVAVVAIDPPEDLSVAVLATGVPVQVGQLAVAIGSPFGLDQTVTAGIVSAVGRSAETPGGVVPAIQTDAPINSGNSGGALADRQGRVIGINDSIITGGRSATGNVGVGFAVPIDIAKNVADRIVAGEPTDAGFLGVEGADATGRRAGAAITAVTSGSPAEEAGLTTDDVVVALDGAQVSSMIDLAAKVRTRPPGATVALTVLRGGEERTLEVVLGTSPGR
jgi:putative serine protease PepD